MGDRNTIYGYDVSQLERLLRLSPRSKDADNPKALWAKIILFATLEGGLRKLLETASRNTLATLCGIHPGLSTVNLKFNFKEHTIRSFSGTPLQKAVETLRETHLHTLETTETFCINVHNSWTKLKAKEKIVREDVERFLFYIISFHSSVRDLVKHLNQSLCMLDVWVKGCIWSESDAQIVAEIKKNTCNWPRDRSERTRKSFMTVDTLWVTVVMDKSVVQHIVFECTKENKATLMTTCTNKRDYKQGSSMVTGGTFSLDCLHQLLHTNGDRWYLFSRLSPPLTFTH